MHPADQLALVVGLADLDVQLQLVRGLLHDLDQLGVGRGAVRGRLPGAEPAEVGAVEDLDRHGISWLVGAAGRAEISAQAASSQAGSGSVRIVGLPRPSRTTKRSAAPRAFLSTRITERSRSQSPAYRVGRSMAVSSARSSSAAARSSSPACAPSSAAKTSPTATAS